MQKKQKPNWIPDWTNKNHYDHLKKCKDINIWAWEFLRRNPRFQAFCNSVENNIIQEHLGKSPGGEIDLEIEGLKFGIFGFSEKITPSQNKPPTFISYFYPDYICATKIRIDLPYGDSMTAQNIEAKEEISIIFSAEWDIESQIEKAKVILKKHQDTLIRKGIISSPGRKTFEKYINYIRILDAKTYSEYNNTKIAEVIFDADINTTINDSLAERVRTGYKSSLELCNGGYAKILGITLP